ncbi:hypothetical protein [Pedobacter sp. P26]|uniref:hypothetical protein n=1 Tax=Pedobacter sp. P26 TaxID=3423956 RepID=UPI003D66E2F4
MKNKLLNLTILTALAICIILFLYRLAKTRETTPNGFVRNFGSHHLQKIGEDISIEPIWRLVGLTDNKIYLGHQKYVQHIKEININDHSSCFSTIGGNIFQSTSLFRASLNIDSPFFFINDSFVSKFFKGNTRDFLARDYKMPKIKFDKAVSVKDGSLIVRLNDRKDGIVIGKAFAGTNRFIIDKTLLKAQGDNYFSKDGILLSDSESGKIVYVYLYRNDFLVIDSSLKRQFEAKTIDTTSHSKIQLGYNGQNRLSMSAPAARVNRYSWVWKSNLFIQSGLRADNEDIEDFNRGYTIDVYDLNQRGEYKYSLQLEGEEKNKLKGFRIRGNLLIALFDQKIKTYKII